MSSMRSAGTCPHLSRSKRAGRALRVVLLSLSLVAHFAYGTERGTSAAGVAYASGGAGDEELEALRAERLKYSFWLTTAARRSGAYLAGVRVRISEAEGSRRVLEHVMTGPWLFADLPLGRYEIEAILLDERTGRLEIQRGTTNIHPGDHHQMLLYFSTGDEVAEDRSPLPGTAHDGPKK
jgi:hypothetical protein